VRIGVVGSKTREEVEKLGYKVWLTPREENAEGLVREFPEGRGEKVLIPRSEQGREEVIEGLRRKGYEVLPLNVYRTVNVEHSKDRLLKALGGGGFLVLASPSAVKSLLANLQKHRLEALLKGLILVAIGKTTKKELEKFGLVPNLIPMKPLMEEVAGKIHEYWQENCTS
jgi:uroporphyrinogen-III synthase